MLIYWCFFVVGVVGGMVGGFFVFFGFVIVVWNGLCGVGKEEGCVLM